jgi:hypothetical protein
VIAACCLVAVPVLSDARADAAVARDCGYVRFAKSEGGLDYQYILQVTVERGRTGCPLARRLMRTHVLSGRSLPGWRCRATSPGAVWRCRLIRGKALVVARALG